jgi:glycosyltransferase involved in cell wall biosynthesis
MSKVLFISAHTPTNQYPQAGHRIASMNLAKYADLHEIVDVIVIANTTETDVARDLITEFGKNLYTYPLSKLTKAINCLQYYQVPLKFASRFSRVVKKKIQELLIKNTYDIVHFEFSHAAVYFDVVQKYTNSQRTRTIISIHDVLTQVWLRQSVKRLFFDVEAARIFRYEQKLYSSASELWVLSEKDRRLLTSLFMVNSEKVVVKPPQASSFVSQVKRRSEKIEKKSLLFWAAMERPENEQAVLTFVEKCFKKIIQQDREFKLYIVGSNPSKKVLALACKQITITGFIEDPSDFFEKAAIGIVPLLEGGGIKLKTLEMLEAGLPVVATSIGAEGIVSMDKKLIVSDNFEDWFEMLTKKFNNYLVTGGV